MRQRNLSAERIVAAALALIDRDGLERLSMRRLGAELGAGATSLYWHVPSKDALLDLVVDQLMDEVAREAGQDPGGTTWRAQLAVHARALRAVLERHASAAPLLATRVAVGPNGLRLMERVLGVLAGAGFSGRQRALAYGAVSGYALGQALLQARPAPSPAMADDEERPGGRHNRRLGTLLQDAPRGRFPNVFEQAADITELSDADQFEYGLQRMLDGLESELKPVNPRRRLF
jgi:AcrR family transcriptional regulator